MRLLLLALSLSAVALAAAESSNPDSALIAGGSNYLDCVGGAIEREES